MSFPSLSRPSLTVWPMLPIGSPALMRHRSVPMAASEPVTANSGTEDATTPTVASIDDSQEDASSDGMDYDEESPPVAVPENGAQDALQVSVESDGRIEEGDDDHLADDVDMISLDEDSDEDDYLREEAGAKLYENGGPTEEAVVQELVRDNDRLTRAVATQHTTIEELRKQLQLAASQVAATEQRLMVVSQDLAASRSFVAKEDVDGQQIRVIFNDLNEGVDDHTFLLLDGVADPPEAAVLDLPAARALLDGHELVRKELGHFVSASLVHKLSLTDFSAFFIPALLNVVLLRTVFRPFIPGLDATRSAHLHSCYEDICRKEPQDRAARWRSITYAQGCPSRSDDAIVAEAVDMFYSALEASLPHLVSSDRDTVASLRTQYSGTAAKIVRDALKLQDLAMATYISFDYRLIAPPTYSVVPPAQADVAELLKRCPHSLPRTDPPEEGQVSLAVVAFGLQASKGTQRSHSDAVERAVTVMKRASVVAATCRWAKAHIS